MTRTTALLALFATLALTLAGCRGSTVGDPCVPENVPLTLVEEEGMPPRIEVGFAAGEVVVEASSVQCRTRTCLVYNDIPLAQTLDPDAVSDDELDNQIYCSCRCDAPPGSDTPTCACPGGFECVPNVVPQGGEGLRGGYCIRRFPGDGLAAQFGPAS
ncbi:MAG: hypothetical protein AAF447_09640 [Myxococcota bacterium]